MRVRGLLVPSTKRLYDTCMLVSSDDTFFLSYLLDLGVAALLSRTVANALSDVGKALYDAALVKTSILTRFLSKKKTGALLLLQ